MITRNWLIALAAGFWASSARATVFWTEGWEGDGPSISANWNYQPASGLGGTSCQNPSDWVDNDPMLLNNSPARDTVHAYSGKYSLHHHYGGAQPNFGGCYSFRPFTPTADLWMRYYEYWGAGMKTGGEIPGAMETKREYMWGNFGLNPPDGLTIETAYAWGDHNLAIGCQYCKENADGTDNGTGLGSTWPTGITSYYYPNMTPFEMPEQQWVCWEIHMKLNTPGQKDAVFETFTQNMTTGGPNIQTMGYYNYEIIGAGTTPGPGSSPGYQITSAAKWQQWEVYTQDGLGDIWTDDFAVGDTRIGCGSAPPAGAAPPSAPKGLKLT